jgi:beta-carotene/zeaxanthin 4-ketolase
MGESKPASAVWWRVEKNKDTMISATLGALIYGSWLVLHIYCVWFLEAGKHPVWAVAVQAPLVWLSVGVFVLAHDCMHNSFAPLRPKVNEVVGNICLLSFMGFSYHKMLTAHKAHHRHVGTDQDPDFDLDHQSQVWGWYWSFMGKYMLDMKTFCVTSAVIMAYAFLMQERAAYVYAYWMLPCAIASFQLFYYGTYLPHRQEEKMPFTDKLNTRSLLMPTWLSLLTSYHFGYHHHHHSRPFIPWWGLPTVIHFPLEGGGERLE